MPKNNFPTGPCSQFWVPKQARPNLGCLSRFSFLIVPSLYQFLLLSRPSPMFYSWNAFVLPCHQLFHSISSANTAIPTMRSWPGMYLHRKSVVWLWWEKHRPNWAIGVMPSWSLFYLWRAPFYDVKLQQRGRVFCNLWLIAARKMQCYVQTGNVDKYVCISPLWTTHCRL